MKILKELLKLTAALAVIFVLGAYAFFLWTLPVILTSYENIAKYEDFLSKKISVPVSIKDLQVKTHPNLSFDIAAKGLYIIPKAHDNLFHADNLKYSANIFNLKHGQLTGDYIFADIDALKKYIKIKSDKNKKPFNFSFYPQTNIKAAQIKFNDKTYIDVDYIKSDKNEGQIVTNLLAKIYSPYTKEPVIIGNRGSIIYKDNFGFKDFSIKFKNAEFLFSGDTKGMKILGKEVPAAELERSFLYFYKLRHPNKRNFLENFDNFKGTIDVDLYFDKKGLTGNCVTHNLGADFSKLKVAVFLPQTKFDFTGREVSAATKGTFGGEPVSTDFYLTGMLTDDLHVTGNVSSPFTNKITKKYFPQIQISGVADANVKYHTHNEEVNVYYTLTVPNGNNIMSQWGNLDNTDKTRVISMHTYKNGDPMKIKSWDYSIVGTNGPENIISGDGNFKKIDGRYNLADLSVKTNGKVPANYIKSFLRDYVHNGTFDTDLRLYFLDKMLLGNINFYNVSHKDFLFLKNTNINVKKDFISVLTEGSFYSSPIKMSVKAANRLSDNILIHSIDIHLNEFFVKKGKLSGISQTFKNNNSIKPTNKHKKKIKFTVEQGRIIADKIYANQFDVRNVNIQGSLKNEIVTFVIPKADYANGLLSAKGVYYLSNYSSNIKFFASDIDSNVVLTEFFHLPNQVKGTAYATLHAITTNKLNDVKAIATFAISDGYMPQIAEKEFFITKKKKDGTIKRKIKISLSKITNLDFSRAEDYSANIYGTFVLDNDLVRNVKMFTKSDYLGMFIEGNYNIATESGILKVWGRRNKTHAKGIRIFKIPLNLIYRIVFKPEHTMTQYEDKIKLIPEVKASIADEIAIFRVLVSGYFNKKSGLKIEMKDLR